ncbi:phosphate signaling complex protein PhoU [Pelagibacteraceae bacterium]|nr:phosphate signaling complex protein PhoU [Pelagibacteraceae bacterium]
MSDHIVSAYDDQLNLINTNLIKLGGLVESQLKNAIKSLSDKDTSLADQVVNDDNKIDDLEKEIHELIYKVIAMRQPIAIDLRTVLSAVTIAKDLERMGDHATNIAKRAADLKIYMPDSPIAEIASMASEVQLSITKVLDAYVAKSGELALEVWDKDIVIDKSYVTIYKHLLRTMSKKPETVPGCSQLLAIAKNIERIGDYVQNIAEDIHFIVKGEVLIREASNEDDWETLE